MSCLPRLACAVLAAAALLAGCGDPHAAAAAQAAAQAARNEQAANQAEQDFTAAIAGEHWLLAKAQADVLLANWPDTEAAARVRGQLDAVKVNADAERERRRLAALWHYHVQAVAGGGQQRSAVIDSKAPVDMDGRGATSATSVQLVFRDHPAWGRSSYLVLERGDFARACYRTCQVEVTLDAAAPRNMVAHRPDTDEAIAMFINNEKALWRRVREGSRLVITFPVRDGSRRTAEFEVSGLDPDQLPGWD